MLTEKPKLGLESVRTFLEFAMERAERVSRQQGYGKKSLGVKFLCISKSYLFRSRTSSFDLYRLNLKGSQEVRELYACISSKCYDFSLNNSINLPSESAHNLAKLLKPAYIGVHFYAEIRNFYKSCYNVFLKPPENISLGFSATDKLIKILNDTDAKIGLVLSKYFDQNGVRELFGLFGPRIHELSCTIDILDENESLFSKLFDRLTVTEVKTSDEMSRILRYKAKQLTLNLSYTYTGFRIDSKNSIDGENLTIKKLTLNCGTIDEDKFEKLVAGLRMCCPNLKQLNVEALFNHGRISSNQVTGNVAACARRINKLKESILGSVTNISMGVNFEFMIDDKNNVWYKTIRNNLEFKDWKFQDSTERVGYSTERNTLEMTFVSEELELKVAFNVVFYDDEFD